MFGSTGNGATAVTITSIGGDVKNVDQTSAARLLPLQVLPGEKHAANGTALRSYSPQDIADIALAATPESRYRTGGSVPVDLDGVAVDHRGPASDFRHGFMGKDDKLHGEEEDQAAHRQMSDRFAKW